MSKNKLKPVFLVPSAVTRELDQEATRGLAVAFRLRLRVQMQEVALLLKSPKGKQMTKQNLNNYEKGALKWTHDFFDQYISIVKKLAAGCATK